MLERLLTYNIYKKNKETKKYNIQFITKLLNNYRSHPKIIDISNKLFYEDELRYHAGKEADILQNWHGLSNIGIPVIFHNVVGEEEREPSSTRYEQFY